jgi:hypothetical protein
MKTATRSGGPIQRGNHRSRKHGSIERGCAAIGLGLEADGMARTYLVSPSLAMARAAMAMAPKTRLSRTERLD